MDGITGNAGEAPRNFFRLKNILFRIAILTLNVIIYKTLQDASFHLAVFNWNNGVPMSANSEKGNCAEFRIAFSVQKESQ
jgi:hypothetical protein